MLHSRLDRNAAPDAGNDPEHFVYVIDDEDDLRESSCFLLATLGINCVQYASGQAFLDAVDTLEPGCILLDVLMRRMGGLEVQDALRERGIEWPIVFMSGHQDVPTVVQAVKNGAVEFLEKPFTDEQLLAALHRGFATLRTRA